MRRWLALMAGRRATCVSTRSKTARWSATRRRTSSSAPSTRRSARRPRRHAPPDPSRSVLAIVNEKLSYRRGTARCVVSVEILPVATHTRTHARTHAHTHTHRDTFNGPLSGTTQVSQYQKGKKPIWILLKQEILGGSGISWAIMQICTSLQTDNHASTPPLLCFLQAGCPSCRPTNSVKALKANTQQCRN